MTDIAIRVENLGKQYRIGSSIGNIHYNTLRDSIADSLRAPLKRLVLRTKQKDMRESGIQKIGEKSQNDTIWALRDVSFELHKGQVLGVIGRNGAGKSTLLKLLSRVTEPSEGYVEIHGRVGSLLEVGTGFHPELTGRENIYLNGAILGMKRSEIMRKFDEIVSFAEVDKFIDTPVKRYSSGMYLRLAFAVAAHLEPEILVVDEVLAVGDAEFQRKCLGKMSSVAEEGRTVLFVSHNMSAILRLTQETILLDKGQLILRAISSKAVDTYISSGFSEIGERVWTSDEIPVDAAPFHPVGLLVVDAQGRKQDTMRSTDPITIEFRYHLNAPITGLRVGIYLLTTRGEHVLTSFDTDDPKLFQRFSARPAGSYISRCVIPPNFLNEGRYILGVNASSFRVKRYFQDEHALSFAVDTTSAPGTQWTEARQGIVRPRLAWMIHSNPQKKHQRAPIPEMEGETVGEEYDD